MPSGHMSRVRAGANTDRPGRFNHWGGAHVRTFPNEGSAEGTVVIGQNAQYAPGVVAKLMTCRTR